MIADRGEPLAAVSAVAPARPAASRGLLDWMADRVVLFRAGNLIFVSYGLMAAIGGALGVAWGSLLLLGQGLSAGELAAMLLLTSVTVVVFSKLAALALDYRLLLNEPVRALRSAAFVSWGGVLALAFSTILFSWLTGYRLLMLMDAVACAMPLAHAIGRLGCLMYGCCFGRPTRSRLSITYRAAEAKAVRAGGLRGVPLHPSPLYEAGWDLALFVFLNILLFAGAGQGVPVASYLLLYALGRIFIEFTRDNSNRFVWKHLAVNHLLAGGLALSGGGFLIAVVAHHVQPFVPSLSEGVHGLPAALPLPLLCGLVIFLGFGTQRHRVGEW